MKKIILSIFVLGFIALTGTASAHMMGNDGGSFGTMSSHSGLAWFGWITMFLVWSLLIIGVVAIIKWFKKTQ